MALINLIYISSAIKEQTDADLDAILEYSVRRNKQNKLTGMLLYAGRNFLQVLEGEEKDVDATFARIEKDARHNGIIIIDRETIPFRSFEKWHMGFHRIKAQDVVDHPGYAPFFEKDFSPEKLGIFKREAFGVLLTFAESYKEKPYLR